MERFWFKTCPKCDGQGRLFICENSATGRLYLHCEECEHGFLDPDQCAHASAGFLAIDIDYNYASRERIESLGWGPFALRSDA
jgi:hypothetical protein